MRTPTTVPAALVDILSDHGLQQGHPADVEDEAQALAASPFLDDPTLDELRDVPFVTIDERTSLDLDQAVAVEATDDGFRLWYAIADAAWFVRPGTRLFDEALRRGASYYLPGLVIPMLPRVLSEDVVSLNPQVDRRALVFELTLGADGRCVGRRLRRGRVRSRAKLSYDGVQAWLDGAAPPEVPLSADVQRSLRLLHELGEARLRLAEERDVVRYRRTELDVGLDGARFVAVRDLRNDVERHGEQVSLLCNVEGARFLLDGGDDVRPIYRTHDAPLPERLAELSHLIDAIADLHGLPDRWRWHPGDSLAAYLASLPVRGPRERIARAIHRQAVIANRGASFSADPGPHHGVGADVYARLTAPMREIVGVYLHGEVWHRLGLQPSMVDGPLRDEVIARSNQARSVQSALDRVANRLVLDQLFDEAPRARHATIMGLTRTRVHLQLDEPPIDAKAYVAHLADLTTRDDGAALVRSDGTVAHRVGDEVAISVEGRDARSDRWRLAVLPP